MFGVEIVLVITMMINITRSRKSAIFIISEFLEKFRTFDNFKKCYILLFSRYILETNLALGKPAYQSGTIKRLHSREVSSAEFFSYQNL